MKKKMTADRKTHERDSAKVYDAAANDFRQKAPDLVTYRYIVKPSILRNLDKYVPDDRGRLKVLDIGSASGRNVHTLAAEGFKPENFLGVEISGEQVAIAQREIPEAKFEVGNIVDHKLPSDAHDLDIMVMVAEFLSPEDYPVALTNIYNSTAPGGTFLYITTHPDRYDAKYGVSSGGAEVTTQGPWDPNQKFSNYVRSVEEQKAGLEAAGFVIEEVEELDLPDDAKTAHPDFTHADRKVRLVIVATKPE